MDTLTETYGNQIAFLQVNKANNMFLVRSRFNTHGYPSFLYVQPGTGGKKTIKFEGQRTYEKLFNWAERQIKRNGGKPLIDDDIDIEIDGQQVSHQNVEELLDSEIVSISDADSGEEIHFTSEAHNLHHDHHHDHDEHEHHDHQHDHQSKSIGMFDMLSLLEDLTIEERKRINVLGSLQNNLH